MNTHKLFLVFAMITIVLLSGCGDPNLPDLFPRKDANGNVESQPSCVTFDSATGTYHLNSIKITNFGADLPETDIHIKIGFSAGDPPQDQDGPTVHMAINAGRTTDPIDLSSIVVPNSCTSGSCIITITVDSTVANPAGIITEGNEQNNSAICQLPG